MTTSYKITNVNPSDVLHLFEQFHAYGSVGCTATYGFAVVEDGKYVAAYLWQPPAPGAAKSTCPESPGGVLALSRMVAVPKAERRLNHVSKPLRRQMRVLIDRGRWPVLITYSDASVGHIGHVYKCSGWERTRESRNPIYEDAAGRRVSSYSNGKTVTKGKSRVGYAKITRWEHWACARGHALEHMARAGWVRVPVIGKRWRSGNQAHRWERSK